MTGGRPAQAASASGRLLLAAALVVAVWSSGLGVSRPAASLGLGDAPRYLMDGVFLLDLLESGTLLRPSDMLRFADRYYAQYPALSLGHHPPLFPASLVPFFLAMGVSALAARLAMAVWLFGAVWLLYGLGRRLYDERVAGWTALLFASCPVIVSFAGQTMAEVPTIAVVLVAILFLERFRASGRVSAYLLFCAAVIASLLTRPTSIYMFPAYALLLLRGGGLRRLTSAGVTVVNGIAVGVVGVMALGYMTLSPFNSSVVAEVIGRGVSAGAATAVVMSVLDQRGLALAMAVGLAAAALTRDGRVIVPLVWVLSVLTCTLVLTGAIEAGRYGILATPAMCLIGASVVAAARTRVQLALAGVGLASLVVLQVAGAARRPATDLPGYEAAARYVVGIANEPTVLYSASADTGYFVFFVRQHDQDRRLAVLRSDKLLTTSRMANPSVESRIAGADEIPGILQRYGTRFVVIEDQPTGDPTLEWLRELVRTERFVARRRIPVGPGIAGVDVVVYEYLDATPAADDAVLDLNIPLVGRRISVRLADIGRPIRR